MKKRITSLLILLFMVGCLTVPILNNESYTEQTELETDTYKTKTTEEIMVVEEDPYEIAIKEMQMKMHEIEVITDKKEWFIAYKDIVFEYAKWIDPPETVFDYFTEDEVRLICQVVETETYQQDFESKVNVAHVVFNRFYSGEFGETMTEVITSPYQFAYGREKIEEDTILAVMYAFEVEDTTDGALFFHSGEWTETFCGGDYLFSDDAIHHFYK